MGLLSSLFGNATQVDAGRLAEELAPVLAPGEVIGRAFKVFRDMIVFTDHRLIMIDKQGMTGSKVGYHSIPYRSITQFRVETAGVFDGDGELKIWVSGRDLPLAKEFKKGTDIVGMQQYLAYCLAGGKVEKENPSTEPGATDNPGAAPRG